MKFEVGDIITGVADSDYTHTNDEALMVVSGVKGTDMYVTIIEDVFTNYVFEQWYVINSDELFTLTTPKEWIAHHGKHVENLLYFEIPIATDFDESHIEIKPCDDFNGKQNVVVVTIGGCLGIVPDYLSSDTNRVLYLCNNEYLCDVTDNLSAFELRPITPREYFSHYPKNKGKLETIFNHSIYSIEPDSTSYYADVKKQQMSVPPRERSEEVLEEKYAGLVNDTAQKMVNYLKNFEYSEDEYYTPFEAACKKIAMECFTNKHDLLKLFEHHHKYDGEGRIVYETEFDRDFDKDAIESVGIYLVNKAALLDEKQGNANDKVYRLIYRFFDCVRANNYGRTWSMEQAVNMTYAIRTFFPDAREVHSGQKVSKTLAYIGKLTKLDEVRETKTVSWTEDNGDYNTREKEVGWNYQLAKFGDAINPMAVKMPVIISLNILDFLGMSIGHKWRSCHSISRVDGAEPNNYDGCYSGGTMSYGLDGSSIIMYYVWPEDIKENPDAEWYQYPKFKRCIFAWNGEDVLLQSRVYPDGRDGGDASLAGQMRAIMQNVIADLIGEPNMWKVEKGTERCGEFTETKGVHYRDYLHYEDTNVSLLKGHEEYPKIRIGHNPICPCCGTTHQRADCIECNDCAPDGDYVECDRCGSRINLNDDYYIYCEDNECYYCDRECANEDGVNFCVDDSEWHDEDDCTYEECSGEYYYYNTEGVDTDDGWFHNEETANEHGWYRCETDGEYHKENEMILINGEYYLLDDEEYSVSSEIVTPSQAVAQQQ